eukprot:5186799-Prymnesium_polylepis.2
MGERAALSSGGVKRDASTAVRILVTLGILKLMGANPVPTDWLHTRHSTASRAPHSRTAPTCTTSCQLLLCWVTLRLAVSG